MTVPSSDAGGSAGRDFSQTGQYNAGRDIVHNFPAPERRPLHALPRTVTRFVGRAAQVAAVVDLLDPERNPAPLVNVFNGSGYGKTTLAVHAAHQVKDRFPGGQLYVELARPGLPELDAGEALRQLLFMLGRTDVGIPEGVAARSALFRAELPDRSLLVLDNASPMTQIADLLPGHRDSAVLVTSRSSLAELEGIREVELGQMPAEDAYALLADRIGQERAASDPAAAGEIVQLCDAMPLALHLAAAQLARPSNRHVPLAEFAARLRSAGSRLDVLASGQRDLRGSFLLSYQELSPAAARLFRLLGWVQVPSFRRDFAEAVDGTGPAGNAFGELVDAHLLEWAGGVRARMHSLVAEFARERAAAEDLPAGLDEAAGRAIGWCVQLADTAPLDELDPERDVLLAMIRRAGAGGRDQMPSLMVRKLAKFFETRGIWADWLDAAEIAVACAERTGDRAQIGEALLLRSWPRRLLRQTGGALQDAVVAVRELDTIPGTEVAQAQAHAHLAILLRETFRYEEAVRELDTAAAIFRATGDAGGEGGVLRTLGHVLYRQRDLQAASATLDRAIGLLRRAELRDEEGWARNLLGAVHGATWGYDRAAEEMSRARDIFTSIGNRLGVAWTHAYMSQISLQYAQPGLAAESAGLALAIFRDLAEDYGAGWALLYLGAAHRDADQVRDALALFRQMGPRGEDGQGWSLLWLARILGDRSLTREALAHFAVTGSLQGEGTALSIRGDLERAAGLADDAEESYRSALIPLERCADLHREAVTRLGLAEIARSRGDTALADELARPARAALTRLGAPTEGGS